MSNLQELNKEDFIELKNLNKMLENDINNFKSDWYNNKEEYLNYINNKYSKQLEKVPAIYKIIESKENKFDISCCRRLEFLLNQASKVYNKDIAEHDASVAVGSKLVEEIVKPQLNK